MDYSIIFKQMIFPVFGLTLLAIAQASKYTVTEEAWFEVEVSDLDGPGEDYVGRFTIALFGETAPMTVMNFASITKGYKKGKVDSKKLLTIFRRPNWKQNSTDFAFQ